MSLGKEMKDFLATYTAVSKQREDQRYHDILKNYYEGLLKNQQDKSGKTDGKTDAYNAGVANAGGSGASRSGGAGTMPAKEVYQSARDAGFSDNQARALTAEVGRENGLQRGLLFGLHTDSSNGATNVGALSWQGPRATGLMSSLKERGLLDENGKIKQTPEALTEQFRFMKKEMETDPTYAQTKKQFLDNPNIDPEAAAPVLGRNYIRWRYDDPSYASHHDTRKRFLSDVNSAVPRAADNTPAGELPNRVPNKLPNGPQSDVLPMTTGDAGDSAIPDGSYPQTYAMAEDTSPSYDAAPAQEMAVPDYTQFGSQGGMIQPVKAYLGGGLEDDEEDDAAPAAIPVGGAAGVPTRPAAPAAPEKDGLLGMALHAGITTLQNLFGLSDAQAAEAPGKAAVPADPAAAQKKVQAQRLLMSGMGAMPQGDYDEVMQSIDPDGKMDAGLRSISGIKAVYDYHMNRGEMSQASQAAAAMIQRSRDVSAQYAGAAEAAIKSGQYPKAAELLTKSYDYTLDGNKATAQSDAAGHGEISVTDKNGKVIMQQRFTPQAMMEAALGLKNGSLFYDSIARAAGKNLGDAPSGAYKHAVREIYGIDPEQGSSSSAPGAIPGSPTREAPPPPPPPSSTAPATTQEDTDAKDGFAVPKTIVPASTDQPLPQSRPQAPQVPTMMQPNKQHMANMSEDERDSYMAEIKKENARRQAEYGVAQKGYRDAEKEYTESLKGAASKPLDPGFAGKIGDEIKETMPTYIAGFADPTKVAAGATGDGVGFGDEKKAGEFIGKANQLKISTIAKDIAMRNPGARDGNAAVAAASALVQPDTDNPKAANFKPLGRTPDGSVVLQASDGRRMVVGADTYAQIRVVSGDLYNRYDAAIKKAKQPTKTDRALSTIKEGVKGAYNEAIKPATPEQLRALPVVPTPSMVPQKPSMGQAIPVPGGLPNGKPLFSLPNPDYSPQ